VNSVSILGDKFRIYVDDVSEFIQLLVDFAQENNLKIVSFNTSKTTLEDVFVKTTGLSPEVMLD